MKIKNVADNLKKFNVSLKQFLYTYSFYILEEYVNQLWKMNCITKIALYIGIVWGYVLWYTE